MSDNLPVVSATDDRWMGIVQNLMQRPDFSIEQLERILALRSKELDDQAREQAVSAYAACQAEVGKASTDKANPIYHSRYASLGAMYDAVMPAVQRYGFGWSVSWLPTPQDWDQNILIFEGTLSRGRWEKKVQLPVDRNAIAVPEGPRGGRPAMTITQSVGSLTTYMRKYLLGLMFNVVTADDIAMDDDGEGMRRTPLARSSGNGAEPADQWSIWLTTLDAEAAKLVPGDTAAWDKFWDRNAVKRAFGGLQGEQLARLEAIQQRHRDRLFPEPPPDEAA